MGVRRLAALVTLILAATAAFAMDPLMDVPVPPSFDATAVASGAWNDPATWGGSVPANGAFVDIPAGKTVTLSGTSARIEWIQVKGILALSSTSSSTLYVETIVVHPGGRFTLEPELPATYLARVIFISTGEFLNDPKTITRGLVAAGRVTISGAPKTHMRRILADVPKGADSVTVETAPEGWEAGDEVVVAGTYFRREQAMQDERVAIGSVTGTTVTLADELEHDHLRVASGITIPPLHIVNLTRNVRFESESTAATSHRGHIMLMHDDSTLQNVAFIDLGRTDKSIPLDDFEMQSGGLVKQPDAEVENRRGRYAVHVHMTRMNPASNQGMTVQQVPPTLVAGCVVDRTTGWGFVNHSSHVDFRRNVAYGFTGAGFVTEAGDELGKFIEDVAIRGIGQVDELGDPVYYKGRLNFENTARPHPVGDIAFSGVGFWFSGPALLVRDIVANSCNGDGVIWHTTGTVDVTQLDPVAAPFARYTHFPEEWIDDVYGAEMAGGLKPRHWKGGPGKVVAADLPILFCRNIDSYANLIGLRLRFNNHHAGSWYGEEGFNYWTQVSAADGEPDKQSMSTRVQEVLDGTINLWNNEEAASVRYVSRATLTGVNAQNRLDYDPDNPDNAVGINFADGIESGHTTEDIIWNEPLVDGYEVALAKNALVTVNDPDYRNFAVDVLAADPQPCQPLAQKPTATPATGGTATIAWESPSDAARLRHLLRYKATDEQQWRYKTKGAAVESAAISGLTAGKTYQAQVICGCSGGSSIWSRPASFVAE